MRSQAFISSHSFGERILNVRRRPYALRIVLQTMKRRFATLCVAILTLTTLSGCIGEAPLPTESESLDDPVPPNETSLFDECIEHDGMERCWLTHIPSTYDAMNPPPLLINMHGFGGTNSDFYNYSRFDVLAETEGFVTLYPQGVEDSWNAGWCCGEAKDVGIDDVDFILTMIETVSDNISFDATRIYSSGHSNGCAMTHKLANEASDVFAVQVAWRCTCSRNLIRATARSH